jgi:hypothetical protein
MHAQARSKPAKSPASLLEFLEVLEGAGISIQSASGSHIEQGGEFAFGLEHADGDMQPYEDAKALLEGKGYKVRIVVDEAGSQLHTATIDNVPGALATVIRDAASRNSGTDRVIKDIAVGSPDPNNPSQLRVQIYSDDPLT